MTKPRTYYRVQDSTDVTGILVVETGDEGVRVMENRAGWSAPFWMPAGEFTWTTSPDSVEKAGLMKEPKFDSILESAS